MSNKFVKATGTELNFEFSTNTVVISEGERLPVRSVRNVDDLRVILEIVGAAAGVRFELTPKTDVHCARVAEVHREDTPIRSGKLNYNGLTRRLELTGQYLKEPYSLQFTLGNRVQFTDVAKLIAVLTRLDFSTVGVEGESYHTEFSWEEKSA